MLCRPALAVAALLSLGPMVALSQSAAPQPDPQSPPAPMRVTTDTPEYCDMLAAQVAHAEQQKPQRSPQIQQLATEGHHMCANGLIRGGLVRLRRALILLQMQP